MISSSSASSRTALGYFCSKLLDSSRDGIEPSGRTCADPDRLTMISSRVLSLASSIPPEAPGLQHFELLRSRSRSESRQAEDHEAAQPTARIRAWDAGCIVAYLQSRISTKEIHALFHDPLNTPQPSARMLCGAESNLTLELYHGVAGLSPDLDAMTEDQIRKILEEYKAGRLSPEDALARLRTLPFEDLGFANVDHHRSLRQGFPEVIFGAGKTVDQVARIVESMYKHDHNILVTRTTAEHFDRVKQIAPEAEFHECARAIAVHKDETIHGKGTVMVVSAGTSDMPVAEEAVVTLKVMGNHVGRLYTTSASPVCIGCSIGANDLSQARVVIVVAGMEGALPSVVGGSGVRSGHCGSDQHRLWRQLQRRCRPAGHAEQLRVERDRRQHRQRFRRRRRRQPDQPAVACPWIFRSTPSNITA